ncbi:16S rRNA (cytosine(1402)-N(4))-methyltransferase RsmH [Chordicoccus furentiruminis]|jgi:16S rRNA (cytosine1402-N4)-methyltransferase|uniref:16S rRNA (cytosine(1402)-N(4))-methyltransferase RsmH n=1 Tax=Chordicoccus furentiruminis TaxID=2709410 RepID=UPI0023A8222F|nr:16S rRNA (cytosine(1402)-N(4))-methyltransferase RsmH [Chordicoccus furentiruminis]
MAFVHKSVLLDETVSSLRVRPGGVYVDGTLGGGGHSLEIAKRMAGQGRLIGIDRDEAAIEAAGERLRDMGELVTIVRGNFDRMPSIVQALGIQRVNGIILDLGVSSYQLDTADRGFSYMQDAPLDMRMDQREKRTAGDIVNGYSEHELFRIIRDYGEERFAQNIAKHIVAERERKRIETTGELASIIRASIPKKVQATGGHPAKRTFQAIRIELNGELTALEDSLDGMINLLDDGGRIAVITFHSLEDRIVKAAFRRNENPCTCPPDFPVCVCGKKPKGFVVTRKPVIPSEEETAENPRAKSAKLRVFERKA